MTNQSPQTFKFNFNTPIKMDTSFMQNKLFGQEDEPKQNLQLSSSTKGDEIYTENIQIKLNDQKQIEKNNESILLQLMGINTPEMKQINPQMLMNVHKLLPDLSLYLQIGLKTIAILDSQMNILSETSIFGENANGIQGDILKQNAQQYCVLIYRGIIYIQMFNDIYHILNGTLKHLCQIPALNGINSVQFYGFSPLRGQIFTTDNQLYILNKEQIYIFNNGKFKYVGDYFLNYRANQQHHDYFCQFGNNVFCLKLNQVFRLRSNLQFTTILRTKCDFEILCVQGGIILISLLQTNEIIAINMLTDGIKNFSDVYGKQKALEISRRINSSRVTYQISKCLNSLQLLPTEIQQLFSFGECGLQLRVELQKQIFGEQFPEKCRAEYEKYMKSQMTEAYIHKTMTLIKPVREDWKELEEKYTGMAVVEEKEKYLHDCQLLNVMKLAPNLDVYMAVEDGFIHIIDKDRKILHQIEVDYDYYVGKQFSNPDQKRYQSLVNNFVNNITFHDGSMYVQAFNKVFRIHNMKTELVACLPYLNLDYFKAYPQSVGSDSQYLVVHGHLQRQYILNNSKFKFNKYSSLQCFNFYGHCCSWDEISQCIIFSKFDQELVYDDDHVFDTKSVSKISFCSSGILIMNSEESEIVYVFNIVTQQIEVLHYDNRFSKNNIYNNVELGVAGLQLKKEIITELFGEEAIYKIQEAYENFYKIQTTQYPELENELNSFIALVKEFPEHNTKTELSCHEISKPVDERSILQKCQLMNVVKLKSDYNIYLAIEDNNMYVFDDQRRIYGQYQVDYDMYAGIYDAKYSQTEHRVSYASQYNAYICNGEIYVRRYDSLYKVLNKQLLYIANIPYIIDHNEVLESVLLSYKNKLYAFSSNGIIYVLTNCNNSYSFCPANDQTMIQKQYQFCDKFLIFDRKTYQMSVQGCQNYVNKIGEYRLELVVNHGGILILKTNVTQTQKIFYFINLVSGQIVTLDNEIELDEIELLDSIETGGCGLQIYNEVINEIFGKQPGDTSIQEQANEVYKSYLTDLEQNSQNWNTQIDQLLSMDLMLNYFTDYKTDKFQQINNSLAIVQEKVLTKLNYVKEKVTEVTNKFSRMFDSFTENNRTESTQ
ncbi:Conserved_hypothetical protein [Hexamita inflata]|uniref:Uncharacterized protein n=1 Tax=Hexamita inflata TaxID=28002 RepID=A0AA86Q4U5_9EUKA|nr:Conserved hypothetical protein [Hexamita inflata]